MGVRRISVFVCASEACYLRDNLQLLFGAWPGCLGIPLDLPFPSPHQ